MDEDSIIRIAMIAIDKGYDSDYIYGTDIDVDDVWEYVVECKQIGTVAFYELYEER